MPVQDGADVHGTSSIYLKLGTMIILFSPLSGLPLFATPPSMLVQDGADVHGTSSIYLKRTMIILF